MAGKAYHRGTHPRIAAAVVAQADANPDYRCPTCHLTRAEGIAKWGVNGQWEGGHVKHGDPRYGEHAQHVHCNRSEGASYGNALRNPEPRITRWWD